MWYANALGFSERIGGIIFVGAFSPDQQIADRVDEGNIVTLQKGDKKNPDKIIVKETKFEGAGFTGVICGFEPPVSEFEGMKIGDEISFQDYHVFCCKVYAPR